jgi:hypothetical protein
MASNAIYPCLKKIEPHRYIENIAFYYVTYVVFYYTEISCLKVSN